MRYRLTRKVRTPAGNVAKGTIVFRFVGPTYGVISPDGVAVSLHGPEDGPFFEVPKDAIERI